jgi:hypothetical protein
MEWLLIVAYFTASGVVSVEQIGVESQAHCLKAAEVIRETQVRADIALSCVKVRGELPTLSEMFNSKKAK